MSLHILVVTLSLPVNQFSHFAAGFAEQRKISSGSQEADDRQTVGPMPPPRPAEWGPPQGLGDL